MIIHFTRNQHANLPIWNTPRPSLQEVWVEYENETALELLNRLPERGIAVVGTRNPQQRSEALTQSLVRELRTRDFIILSGLARGIDSCAHEAALDASIPTIAVIGCGLDHHYPPESAALRARILNQGGLIVSEFPPHAPPVRHQFAKRNRCIAAWSKAVCVIEAPAKSGALLTADYAMDQHTSVFAVPAFPRDPASAGNQRLLDEHSCLALWGAHSLGAVWLELSSASPQDFLPGIFPQLEAQHLQQLVEWSHSFEAINEASWEQILPLAERAGWNSSLFFAAWDRALQLGLLRHGGGRPLKKIQSSL